MSVGESTQARWIDSDDELADIINELDGVAALALDTEFHRERTYFPKLALLQIAYEPNRLLLIDPLAVDLAPFARVLESDTTIVVHAASQDLEVLRLVTGTTPRHLFDTQIAAGFLGYSTPSLATLHSSLLDITMDKSDRLTDWLVRPLSESVLAYAADDVRYLLRLRDTLNESLASRGRLGWALDECLIERDRGAVGRDPAEAWQRVKGAGKLRGRAAAVVRSVAEWRERRAAQLDIPVRHVMGDLSVVSIAQRPPRDAADLKKIRGLDARNLKGTAMTGLLEAVAHGLNNPIPDKTMPRAPQVDEDLRPAAALLSSWLSQYAHELQIDTQMLATRSDIEYFVAGTDQGRLAAGWRRDLVGEPMRQLLDGTAALAFDRARGIVLEPRAS